MLGPDEEIRLIITVAASVNNRPFQFHLFHSKNKHTVRAWGRGLFLFSTLYATISRSGHRDLPWGVAGFGPDPRSSRMIQPHHDTTSRIPKLEMISRLIFHKRPLPLRLQSFLHAYIGLPILLFYLILSCIFWAGQHFILRSKEAASPWGGFYHLYISLLFVQAPFPRLSAHNLLKTQTERLKWQRTFLSLEEKKRVCRIVLGTWLVWIGRLESL